MNLFAEVDPIAFWTAIITAALVGVGSIVTTVVGMILAYKRDMAAAAQRADTAVKITQVGRDLQENTKHINSMKDQLVAAEKGLSRAEGTAEGIKSEQDRAESKKPQETVIPVVLKDGKADVVKGDKVLVGGAESIAIVKSKDTK